MIRECKWLLLSIPLMALSQQASPQDSAVMMLAVTHYNSQLRGFYPPVNGKQFAATEITRKNAASSIGNISRSPIPTKW